MATLTEIFQQILNTSAINAEILASIVIFAVIAFIGCVAYLVFGRYFSRWTQKTETTIDDKILVAVKVIIVITIIVLGIEYALSPLSFLQPYKDTLTGVFTVLQILLGAFACTKVSNAVTDWYAGRTARIAGKNSHHLLFLLKKIVQIVIFIFAFLIILYVFGVNLTGAVVGLGVGGIAIAFALQSTLSDFFSAFSIYFDRPFEIGDFIVVGEYSGTVTSIGIKSTRLKLLQGEELIVSNKELTSASVRNFRKLQKRRVTFTISVTYDTPIEKLKKIPQIIADIINNLDTATLERVHFTEFGDCSPKFLISYYVNSSEYAKYLDTQQQINFSIKEAFEHEGIEMAFRTSTVYIKKHV
ncbi:MAG: mechanosensitive ion channel family protein [Candidatus Bathyarchaeia archaeon]|jgi:small-conductance mechanosensitive channel